MERQQHLRPVRIAAADLAVLERGRVEMITAA
jgi:hypothetical protein